MTPNEILIEGKKTLDAARKISEKAEKESRNLTDEEQGQYDALIETVTTLGQRAARMEQERKLADELDASRAKPIKPPVGPEDPALTPADAPTYRGLDFETRCVLPSEPLLAGLGRQATLPDGLQASDLSLGRYVRGLITGNWADAQAEAAVVLDKRAMSVGTDTLGGFLVPDALGSRVIDLARAQSRVIQAGAQTLPMETKSVTIAKVATDPTPAWHGENATITATDGSIGAIRLEAKTLNALTFVSRELVEDSPNASQVIEDMLRNAMALELDRVALRGTGSGIEPQGLRNATGVDLIDKASVAVTLDDFSQAAENIAAANGPDGGLSAIYAPKTAGKIDRFVDGNGRFLEGPASFRAMRKFVTTQVPVNLGGGADETELYVGSFRELIIGLRTQLRVQVLNEFAADKLQVGLLVYLRADVAVARAPFFSIIINATA